MTFMVLGRGLCALAVAACALSIARPAAAQTNPVRDDNGRPYSRIIGCDGINPVSAENPFCVTGGAGGGGGGTEYTEDAASPANPVGGYIICRRRDTLTSAEVSADGDNIALNCTSKGQAHVFVDGTVTANIGTAGTLATAAKQDTEAAKLDTLITAAQDTTPVSVKIDQTTPGTTDSVTVKNLGAQGTGSTYDPPTGGSGPLGFLSGILAALKGTLTVTGDVIHDNPDNNAKSLKMGCVYKASPGAVASGDRADVLCSPAGAMATYIGSPAASMVFATVQGLGLGTPSGNNVLHVQAGMLNNKSGGSTSVEAGVTIPAIGLNRSGAGVQATAMAATNDAGQAIPRTVSGTSAVAGMQLCSAACNWFGGSVTAAAAGYYIIYDQSSATPPADGTQTWAICRAIGVGTTTFPEFRNAPARFVNGAYAVKSSTGCGTKTAVTDAFFESYAVQ